MDIPIMHIYGYSKNKVLYNKYLKEYFMFSFPGSLK